MSEYDFTEDRFEDFNALFFIFLAVIHPLFFVSLKCKLYIKLYISHIKNFSHNNSFFDICDSLKN